jgi:hypothetical protein
MKKSYKKQNENFTMLIDCRALCSAESCVRVEPKPLVKVGAILECIAPTCM